MDKVVYFAGDTVRLTIGRNDSVATALITPVLPIEGASLKIAGRHTYITILPPDCHTGSICGHSEST